MKIPTLEIALVACLASAWPAMAQTRPAAIEALTTMKLAAYDRAIARRQSPDVVVAVLFDPTNATSLHDRTQAVAALRQSGITRIAQRPVKVVELSAAEESLLDHLMEQGVSVAFLTRGLTARLDGVLAAAYGARALTIGAGGEDLVRAGVGVAIDATTAPPRIWIGLDAVRACGSDFPASVLHLRTVSLR